jgi:hypothetical protein
MKSLLSAILVDGVLCLSAAFSLGGCNSANFGGIRGPNPTMQSSEVAPASDNTRMMITALANDNDIHLSPDTLISPAYYNIAVAGFNFIDDQCANYFDHLFYVQRDKQLADNIIQAGSQATSAVLTITRASQITLGVVAAAFGLSSSTVDAVAGTFLYQLPPSTTYGLVKEIQRAYRDGVDQTKITTSSAAYHVMQDYLAICLPPNIEARVVERVASTVAKPEAPVGSNSAPTVQMGDRTSPATVIKVIATKPIPVVQTTTLIDGGLNDQESRIMRPVGLAKIQNAFCVEPTSKWDSATRAAVVNFFIGVDGNATKHQYVKTDGITRSDAGILVEAITEAKQNTGLLSCSQLSDSERADRPKTLGQLLRQ